MKTSRSYEIIGCITTPQGLSLLSKKQSQVDWIEVRVDALLEHYVLPSKILAALKARKNKVLLTLRSPIEGGAHRWTPGVRKALALELLPVCDAIDLELASLQELKSVYHAARHLKKKVILSTHSIQKPVPVAQLHRWIRQMRCYPAWISKLAVRVETQSHLRELASLLISNPKQSFALMGLGSMAPLSRRVMTALGSKLVYGYLDRPAAPGQPSVKEIISWDLSK
ncbi:MAG: type I 3-dehydroquinate dehydratase [Verrucomicrobiota bacterium]